MSDPPKISEGFYGTGESLLFTFVDKKAVKVFAFRSILFFFRMLPLFLRPMNLCISPGLEVRYRVDLKWNFKDFPASRTLQNCFKLVLFSLKGVVFESQMTPNRVTVEGILHELFQHVANACQVIFKFAVMANFCVIINSRNYHPHHYHHHQS